MQIYTGINSIVIDYDVLSIRDKQFCSFDFFPFEIHHYANLHQD